MNKDNKGLTLSEMKQIIEETIQSLHEGTFDAKAEKIKKNWGGEEEPEEEFDAEEFFGDAGDAAEEDIKDEYGEEEFAPFGTMEDPRMLKDLDEDIKNFTGDIPYVPGKVELRAVKNQIEDLNPNYTMKFDALKVRSKGLEISYDVDKGVYKVINDSTGEEYYNKITYPECSNCTFKKPEDVVEFIRGFRSGIKEEGQPGLFRPQDSEGNDIALKSLVTNLDGSKKGRVLGFGDDGAGSLIVRVDWQWPTDMKFMAPKEMGEKQEKPEELIVQSLKEEEIMEENLNENEEMVMAKSGLHNAIMDYHNMGGSKEEVMAIVDTVFGLEETIEESGRGLGKGVKNSGDRNVKQRDDHHSAPLTNLNESVDNSIKTLFEGSVTKKDLQNFIIEEAKNVAKQLKG